MGNGPYGGMDKEARGDETSRDVGKIRIELVVDRGFELLTARWTRAMDMKQLNRESPFLNKELHGLTLRTLGSSAAVSETGWSAPQDFRSA